MALETTVHVQTNLQDLLVMFAHQPIHLKLVVALAFEYLRIFGEITEHRHSIYEVKTSLVCS